jgi:[glutamine synthetase] adenylyltransferase / [glutamine synthetase]-adenylyl-L-tyrosine phosphorylase
MTRRSKTESAKPAQAIGSKPDPRPVLLAAERDSNQIKAILSAYHLHDIEQADRNLQAMAGEPHHRLQLAEILPILLESLSRTADPDQALNHWERLFGEVTRSSFLDYLRSSPRMLDLLCTIFGNSDALAFTVIRDPMLVYWLSEEAVLSKPPARKELEAALHKSLAHLTVKEMKLEALRRFRRREMLRIGAISCGCRPCRRRRRCCPISQVC